MKVCELCAEHGFDWLAFMVGMTIPTAFLGSLYIWSVIRTDRAKDEAEDDSEYSHGWKR